MTPAECKPGTIVMVPTNYGMVRGIVTATCECPPGLDGAPTTPRVMVHTKHCEPTPFGMLRRDANLVVAVSELRQAVERACGIGGRDGE